MTTKEIKEIITAYEEGKPIEVLNLAIPNPQWSPCISPSWNFRDCDYRVKPEPPKPEYVPFENAEEFLQAQKEHGLYIRFKDWKGMPIIVDDNGIQVVDTISYDRLICYCFLDGTPCGKLKGGKV